MRVTKIKMRKNFACAILYITGFLAVYIAPVLTVELGRGSALNAPELGYSGAPYPLPALPSSPNAVVVPPAAALDLDAVISTPPPALAQQPSEISQPTTEGNTEPVTASLDLIAVLKQAVEEEKQTLATLKTDILNLRNELKTARADIKKQSDADAKEGTPDTLTLALEFPARKQILRNVANMTSDNATANKNGEKSSDLNKILTEQKKLQPLVMPVKPNARSDVANVVKNALEAATEKAIYEQKELGSFVQDPAASFNDKISDIQAEINRVAAKKKYYETDAEIAKSQLHDAVR